MNVMERWLLVMADVRVQMALAAERGAQIDADVVNDVIDRHATDRCDACTTQLCCDHMRLTSLTFGALHAALPHGN